MILFTSLILSLVSYAGEIANTHAVKSSTVGNSSQVVVELGGCSPSKGQEEVSARKAAEAVGLSKEEILARIIYSESLSSGYWNRKCQAPSGEDVMKAVGWGVMNRVKAKGKNSLDAYSDVVFAKKQFRTSFSAAKQNPFAVAFLCPLKAKAYLDKCEGKPSADKLYKTAQDMAKGIVEEFEESGIPQKYKGVSNFFYPRSEFFGEMRPGWANPDPNKGYVNILNADKPCVEYYRLK